MPSGPLWNIIHTNPSTNNFDFLTSSAQHVCCQIVDLHFFQGLILSTRLTAVGWSIRTSLSESLTRQTSTSSRGLASFVIGSSVVSIRGFLLLTDWGPLSVRIHCCYTDRTCNSYSNLHNSRMCSAPSSFGAAICFEPFSLTFLHLIATVGRGVEALSS